MFYLAVALIISLVTYLSQDRRKRIVPTWLILVLVVLGLAVLIEIAGEVIPVVLVALFIWWLVRRPSRQKKKEGKAAAQVEAMREQARPTSNRAIDPIKRYVSTPKRQEALAELDSTPKELAAYIHQEIDTFFLNEWTKMSVIYRDKSNQFDEDVQDNAGQQMREILDAIFTKFAKKKRAEMVEKQAINEELKAQHKQEIDIAMQVYDKWQDKS
ncbi:hypothetical protein RyT2_13690 [Pseudolactococcus yaeyamensis]